MPTFREDLMEFLRSNQFAPREDDLAMLTADLAELFDLEGPTAINLAEVAIEICANVRDLVNDVAAREQGIGACLALGHDGQLVNLACSMAEPLDDEEVNRLIHRQQALYRWLDNMHSLPFMEAYGEEDTSDFEPAPFEGVPLG